MVLGMWLGLFFSFVLNLFHPGVANKAGPDWLWSGGRNDFIRSLYFRPNGSFRRYGAQGLTLTLGLGSASALWLFF